MTVTIKSVRHRAALDYALINRWRIFPVRVNGKQPAFTGSFKDATISVIQIDQWWNEADYNIGLCPDHINEFVVDVEKDGGQEWADKFDPWGCVATRVTRTTSGGWHYWFSGNAPSTVKKLADHIDTRGRGGYVLLPPSVVDGKPYTWM